MFDALNTFPNIYWSKNREIETLDRHAGAIIGREEEMPVAVDDPANDQGKYGSQADQIQEHTALSSPASRRARSASRMR